ncbi:lytic polysaccharide monooxygenase [Krasilnikovia sp. MM14-A1259]|uniref:lytic polysaccharide monooxygenase n=1 Tax=Krasilnikovia sp. MM14-A1259 TaxID=3373539 RepID=UPI003828D5F5
MTHRIAAQPRPAGPQARRLAAVAAAGALTAAAGLLPAAPALAHGAPTLPLSRTAACASGGTDTGAAACRAALAANGRPFGTFDNLRVPGVNGKDRQFVPDGQLCSGGLPEFKGLDLARADWPATKLSAGGDLTIKYRTTIPHQGSFRVYLTKPGYDPSKPLRWSDLGAKPILTADNPPVRDGAYRMSGRLPDDRTGRHVLFTIWQTTSTPDTYYSCSDLVLTGGPTAAAAAPRSSGASAPASHPATTHPPVSRSPQPGVATGPADHGAAAEADGQRGVSLSPVSDEDNSTLGRRLVAAALIALVGITAIAGFRRIRAQRRSREKR